MIACCYFLTKVTERWRPGEYAKCRWGRRDWVCPGQEERKGGGRANDSRRHDLARCSSSGKCSLNLGEAQVQCRLQMPALDRLEGSEPSRDAEEGMWRTRYGWLQEIDIPATRCRTEPCMASRSRAAKESPCLIGRSLERCLSAAGETGENPKRPLIISYF